MIQPAQAETGGKPAGQARWFEDRLVVPIVFATFVLDLATKFLARNRLGPGNAWPDWDLPFRFVFTMNTGSAFGLFPGRAVGLAFLSLIGIAVLLIIYRQQQTRHPFLRLSLGLQLGGAAGNLYDRVLFGYVTDFISVGWWPVFNIADSAIVVGIGILAWFIAFPPKAKLPALPGPGETTPSDAPVIAVTTTSNGAAPAGAEGIAGGAADPSPMSPREPSAG